MAAVLLVPTTAFNAQLQELAIVTMVDALSDILESGSTSVLSAFWDAPSAVLPIYQSVSPVG